MSVGNRIMHVASEILKPKAIAIVAVGTAALSLTGCYANDATAAGPSNANTVEPTASAPVTPGPENTSTTRGGFPLCTDLMKEQNVRYTENIKGFFRYGPDVNKDGMGDPTDVNGNTICV